MIQHLSSPMWVILMEFWEGQVWQNLGAFLAVRKDQEVSEKAVVNPNLNGQ